MLILSLLSAAGASEMSLDWTDKTVRYHAEAIIQHFNPIELLAAQNTNVRVTTLMIASDMTCSGAVLRKGWTVSCNIDEIGLQGVALHEVDTEKVDTVTAEYVQMLTGATIEIVLSENGRILGVDLEGVEKTDDRMSEIQEKLRLIVRRMVAPIDQLLPKKGIATTGDSWKHKNSAIAFEIFSKYGTLGGSVLKYEVIEDEGGEILVRSDGHGNIGLSDAGSTYGFSEGSESSEASSGASSTGYASSSATATLYNVVAQTAGRFDVGAGQWTYLESTAQGLRNQATVPDNFTQAAWMGRINDDGTIEGAGALLPPEEDAQ